MMTSSTCILFLAVVGSSLAFHLSAYQPHNKTLKYNEHYNYYWRQYLGEIPPDAIPGGHDKDGKVTYIGQAYIVHSKLVSRCGIIPVEIHQGQSSVDIPIYGIKEKTDTDIKILCGPKPEYFQWYLTDSKHIFDQLSHKHIIPGGTEDFGVSHIGRLTYGKELKIGKVDTWKGYGEAKIYFAEEKSELRSDMYQVLIYEDNN